MAVRLLTRSSEPVCQPCAAAAVADTARSPGGTGPSVNTLPSRAGSATVTWMDAPFTRTVPRWVPAAAATPGTAAMGRRCWG